MFYIETAHIFSNVYSVGLKIYSYMKYVAHFFLRNK